MKNVQYFHRNCKNIEVGGNMKENSHLKLLILDWRHQRHTLAQIRFVRPKIENMSHVRSDLRKIGDPKNQRLI